METMAKLKVKKVEREYQPCWISGLGVGEYKIIKYGEHWHAYVWTKGDKNWGNSCFYSDNSKFKSVEYASREEAMEAAQRHFEQLS